MRAYPTILALTFAFVFLNPGTAEAQRGGSVRYSGRANAGAARANYNRSSATYNRSSTSYSSAPVRYQKPMNTPAPIGSRPATLPVGNTRLMYGGRSYYYYGGAYYADTYDTSNDTSGEGLPGYPSGPSKKSGQDKTTSPAPLEGRYEVVKPPLGVSVETLPYGAKEIKTGLWEYDEVYYRPAYEDGVVKFIVSNP